MVLPAIITMLYINFSDFIVLIGSLYVLPMLFLPPLSPQQPLYSVSLTLLVFRFHI